MKLAIVGAGLVGRLLAWRLDQLNQGFKISLIDQHDRHFFGTGLVAAAMVAPFTEAVSTDAGTQVLGVKSYHLWEKWLPELEAQTNTTIRFNQKGSIVVAHAADKAVFERFQLKAKAMLTEDNIQAISQKELVTLEPDLADNFNTGLYFSGEGVIDNQALYPALNTYFEQSNNISLIENHKVNQLDSFSDNISDNIGERRSENGKIAGISGLFDYVFDCRGNGARDDLKNFRSVRGEVARVHAPEVNISRAVRLIHPRYPLYIAPRNNHEYIIGATQIESDDNSPVTVRSGLELLSALYSLHKGFSEAHILDLKTGLRPTFSNNQPRVDINNRHISINGLYRHGYLFTPALIDQLIKDQFTG